MNCGEYYKYGFLNTIFFERDVRAYGVLYTQFVESTLQSRLNHNFFELLKLAHYRSAFFGAAISHSVMTSKIVIVPIHGDHSVVSD